jgi:hypothetical protein
LRSDTSFHEKRTAMTIMPKRALAGILGAVLLGATACSTTDQPSDLVSGSVAALDDADGTTVEWPVTTCGTYSGEGCAATCTGPRT